MSLSQKDVEKIAKLSRIAVTPEEVEIRTEELNAIFGWIEQLQEVNTDNVSPMAGVGDFTQRLRDDVVNDGAYKEQLLANGPEVSYGCFVVPKVVE